MNNDVKNLLIVTIIAAVLAVFSVAGCGNGLCAGAEELCVPAPQPPVVQNEPSPPPPPSGPLTLVASRTYGPSSWQNAQGTLQPGDYELPEEIVVDYGNAGRGWLSLNIAGLNLCYQGKAPNNNTFSDTFKFVGAKIKCDAGGAATPTSRQMEILLPAKATLSVNGGGCGSLCSNTGVTLVLEVQ